MEALKLERTKTRLEAKDSDMSGATFTDVKLSGAVFVDSMTDGMTINGIPLADLMAAYRVSLPKTNA